MRKQVFGRKFKRDANERKALIKGLMEDLVLKEKIKTTEEKAKAIKGKVEELVTKAKVKGAAAHSLLQPYLSPKAIEKVIKDLAPRFATRPGGYTRIVKLGERFGDNASMAIIEWVEKTAVVVESPKGTSLKEAAGVVEKKAEKSSKTDKVETTIKAEKPKTGKKSSSKDAKETKKESKTTKK